MFVRYVQLGSYAAMLLAMVVPALIAAEAADSASLLVRAASSDGRDLNVWATVLSDGKGVQAGFTPFTFVGEAGKVYTVGVADYQDRKFDQWENGSKSRYVIVDLSGDDTITAYYVTGAAEQHTITINAYDGQGRDRHMWTTVSADGLTVQVGFAPLNFTGSHGATYSITMSDYEDRVFDHWEDGSTDRTRTLTLYRDYTIGAYYTSETKTGVYVPLYINPAREGGWEEWQRVIDAKESHPSVPFVAAMNPANGVGAEKSSSFAEGVSRLQEAGITVIGYVATDYGERSPYLIKDEMLKYKAWYDVDGIMFDEMSNKPGHDSYYRELNSFAKSIGLYYTKGNPGADVPESYADAADNIAIVEQAGMPSIASLAGWHTEYDKSKWTYCNYAINSVDREAIAETAEYAGLIYITDDVLPNPYDRLPSYFEELVETIDDL